MRVVERILFRRKKLLFYILENELKKKKENELYNNMEDKLKESQPGWKEVKKHISQVTQARWQIRSEAKQAAPS